MTRKFYPYTIQNLDFKIKLTKDFNGNAAGDVIATGKLNIKPYYSKEAIIEGEGENQQATGIKIKDGYVYNIASLVPVEDLKNIYITRDTLNSCEYPDYQSKIGLDLEFEISGKVLDISKDKKVVEFSGDVLKNIIKHLRDKEHKVENKKTETAQVTEIENVQVENKKKLNNK